jgi:hypothetical protein
MAIMDERSTERFFPGVPNLNLKRTTEMLGNSILKEKPPGVPKTERVDALMSGGTSCSRQEFHVAEIDDADAFVWVIARKGLGAAGQICPLRSTLWWMIVACPNSVRARNIECAFSK